MGRGGGGGGGRGGRGGGGGASIGTGGSGLNSVFRGAGITQNLRVENFSTSQKTALRNFARANGGRVSFVGDRVLVSGKRGTYQLSRRSWSDNVFTSFSMAGIV